MEQKDLLDDIVVTAALHRVSVPQACKKAGVAPSTFYRWRKGADARMSLIHAVRNAVREIAGIGRAA